MSPAKNVSKRTKKNVATKGMKKATKSGVMTTKLKTTKKKRKEAAKLNNNNSNEEKKKKTKKAKTSATTSKKALDKMFKKSNTRNYPQNEDGNMLNTTQLIQSLNDKQQFGFPKPNSIGPDTDMYYTYNPVMFYALEGKGFECYSFVPGRQYDYNGMTLKSNSITVLLDPKVKEDVAFIKNMDAFQRIITVDFLKHKIPNSDASMVAENLCSVRHCIQETGKGMEDSDMKSINLEPIKLNKKSQYCIKMTVHKDIDIFYQKSTYDKQHKGRDNCFVFPNDKIKFKAKFQGFRVRTPSDSDKEEDAEDPQFIFPLMTMTEIEIKGDSQRPPKFEIPLPPHPDDLEKTDTDYGLEEFANGEGDEE